MKTTEPAKFNRAARTTAADTGPAPARMAPEETRSGVADGFSQVEQAIAELGDSILKLRSKLDAALLPEETQCSEEARAKNARNACPLATAMMHQAEKLRDARRLVDSIASRVDL